jgi:hypothetical protein
VFSLLGFHLWFSRRGRLITHIRHPKLLDMELDVLYSHIGSPPVVADFPALARCIANKELPHGADIIIGIHSRVLTQRNPLALEPPPRTSVSGIFGQSKSATRSESPEDGETRLSSMNNEPLSLSSLLLVSPKCVGSVSKTAQLSGKGKQGKTDIFKNKVITFGNDEKHGS